MAVFYPSRASSPKHPTFRENWIERIITMALARPKSVANSLHPGPRPEGPSFQYYPAGPNVEPKVSSHPSDIGRTWTCSTDFNLGTHCGVMHLGGGGRRGSGRAERKNPLPLPARHSTAGYTHSLSCVDRQSTPPYLGELGSGSRKTTLAWYLEPWADHPAIVHA